MTLHLGFDPGGSGRKIAHVSAALDNDNQLFIGRLQYLPLGYPGVNSPIYPFLDNVAIVAIETELRHMLISLLSLLGITVPRGSDPLPIAIQCFGRLIVSVDAPSGFAVPGAGRRNTETVIGGNFNTPNEVTFIASALNWQRTHNITPLHQRVHWKLVGFAIYNYFAGVTNAAQLAAATSAGVQQGFAFAIGQTSGLVVLESFPSETYRTTNAAALAVAQQFAARQLVSIRANPLPRATMVAFGHRLQQVLRNPGVAWRRSPQMSVGDCLDSFASMMLGPWALTTGLRGCGNLLPNVRAEGLIVVPA